VLEQLILKQTTGCRARQQLAQKFNKQ